MFPRLTCTASAVGSIHFPKGVFVRGFTVHFFIFRRCLTIATNDNHQINEEITDLEVRLIGADGEQLGIMSSEEALKISEEQGYDLVKIAPNATPPVCRIMDYGKFKFEQTKKEKEAKKNQRVIEVKEIRMGPSIGENDFNTKLKNGIKFLNEGNRVKVSVRFRGREMAHTDIGRVLLDNFAAKCEDIATVDKEAKLEGRNMFMFLSPKPQKPEKKKKAAETENNNKGEIENAETENTQRSEEEI